MGNRVSISFKRGTLESVTLFSHWGGQEFVDIAEAYAANLRATKKGQGFPLDRLEPETVMVDFIRHITQNLKEVTNNLYLGATRDDGDNSDNGHFEIQLQLKKDGE